MGATLPVHLREVKGKTLVPVQAALAQMKAPTVCASCATHRAACGLSACSTDTELT